MKKTVEQRLSELEAELKAAKEEKMAKAGKPFKKEPVKRFDPTERMGMPASAMRAMVEAVPDFRGIAQEQGRVSQPGMLPQKGSGEVVRGNGWREPRPLEGPPGVAICDQMMDVQDAMDRKELKKRLGGG